MRVTCRLIDSEGNLVHELQGPDSRDEIAWDTGEWEWSATGHDGTFGKRRRMRFFERLGWERELTGEGRPDVLLYMETT